MTCAEVEKVLLEDLDAASGADVEAHLLVCRDCQDLRRQLVEIDELNRDLARLSGAPLGFTGKIVSEVSRRRSWPVLGPLAAVLVGVTLLGAGLRWSQSISDAASIDAGSVRQPVIFQDRSTGNGPDGLDDPRGNGIPAQSGSSYMEVVISEPSGRSYIVRVPSTIEIRRNKLTDDRFVKVSH